MSLLVTGAAGFIGSHLVETLLAAGEPRIVCLDNFNAFYDPALKRKNARLFSGDARVEFLEGDFRDALAMTRLFVAHKIERVVHLGAHAGVGRSMREPLEYEHNNVAGTVVLLEAARLHGCQRFVVVSSSTVYGRDARAPFVETAAWGPAMSPYGATKQAAELFARMYGELYGLPVVVVRPFNVYGPRMRPDLALAAFARSILNGAPLPLFGDGSVRRDFTHISDVVRGMIAALRREEAVGHTFNLGHSEPVEIREVIRVLERLTGQQALLDLRPAQSGDMPITCADLTAARERLGYEARVDLETGIAEYVAWLRRETLGSRPPLAL
jgi:UDP-glucuronate 4-epimerase